jgi:hypothetical protein
LQWTVPYPSPLARDRPAGIASASPVGAANLARAKPVLLVGKTPSKPAVKTTAIFQPVCYLLLIISYLSHANFALLRRNIIAFQAAADPYFAFEFAGRHAAA